MPTVTARATTRNHLQSEGAAAPPQKLWSVQDAETDGAGRPDLLLCGWSYSWDHRTENLTFTSGPDPGSGRRRRGGAGPALTPVLLLVMALITAPGHDHVFVIAC